jgi:serine phosphatase RsbU (regulator of sigma subunit)/anti-sigma regulatory factor (Ser/Thr protein kinase)
LGFFTNKVLKELAFTLPAQKQYVPEIKDRIARICREYNFNYKDVNNIMIVIDEAASNIIRHAYKDKPGGGDITLDIKVKEKSICITLIDQGTTFNWKNFRTPDLNHYVDIGKKGGLGVWIIRKLTDKSDYVVTERGNELRLEKRHSKQSPMEWALNTLTSARNTKERFVLATTIFILVIVACTYGYFVYHERNNLKDKYLRYTVDLAKSLSDSSRERIIKDNYLSLIQLLKEIKSNNENISEAFVINTDGRIIAHNDFAKLYTEYSRKDRDVMETRRMNGAIVMKYRENGGYRYDVAYSIDFRGIDMGEVHIFLDKSGIERVMSAKGFNLIIAIMLIFAIAALGIYLLLGLITRPLERLKNGAIAIGEGRLDHRIELEGEDEFSQIAHAFNEMANKFKGAQESLVEQEKMQKEIAVAKEIQQTLLPKNIPDAEGFDIASLYRSAKEVGGDYYDIIKVAPHLIGVIVADVSGKGVPGSLVMTITRTVARLVALKNRSAKSVLTKVNSFVKEDMKKGMFVTAFYLVLNSVNRKINFASAGHDPLILYRAKEDKCYYIKPKGFPLGISLPDDELFKKIMVEENLKLQKDDLIVVYTDGVTEAMNGRREQWGEKRFVDFIKANGKMAPRDFIDKLSLELKEFTQEYPQNDDITIVAIKEKKSGAEMLRKLDKQIAVLRKKRFTTKEIEKELGIDMDMVKSLKSEGSKIAEGDEMKFLAFEHKKALSAMIMEFPEKQPDEYASELSAKFAMEISEKLITNELKRINLLKTQQRIQYVSERKK